MDSKLTFEDDNFSLEFDGLEIRVLQEGRFFEFHLSRTSARNILDHLRNALRDSS